MAAKKVVHYEAEWNTETNTGRIRFKYEDNSKFQWEGQDKAEFSLILQIMQNDCCVGAFSNIPYRVFKSLTTSLLIFSSLKNKLKKIKRRRFRNRIEYLYLLLTDQKH